MPEPCSVAFVGAGYTAREHLKAFRDCGVRLAGITSRTRARAEALAGEYNVLHVCSSVRELYERTGADLVVVTVNELSMNSVARACFEHPWTVLMEKPPGYDLGDAREIQRAARDKGRRVFVALNRRSMSTTLAVQRDLATVDGPRFIKVQDQESQERALAAGQPAKVVENWMFANSIHLIDYFRLLGRGRIVDINRVVPWRPERPGVVLVKLGYESGDLGLYEGIWHGPGPWAISVTVPRRRWELRPLEQAVTQTLGESARNLEPHAWDKEFKPGFRLQAELAVQAITGCPSDDPLRRLATLDDAVETMELIGRIFAH